MITPHIPANSRSTRSCHDIPAVDLIDLHKILELLYFLQDHNVQLCLLRHEFPQMSISAVIRCRILLHEFGLLLLEIEWNIRRKCDMRRVRGCS
jgi:hypothetical protein